MTVTSLTNQIGFIMLTLEIVATLDDKTVRTLSKSADETTRSLSFQVIAQRAEAKVALNKALEAEAISFAKQSHFELSNGSLVTLPILAMMAYSSLPTKAKSGINETTGKPWEIEATPALMEEQGEAWDTLRKIQRGIVADGGKLSLTKEGLRQLIG